MVYLTIMAKAFRQSVVYRINVYTGLISSLLGLMITVSLWSALLANGRTVQGIQLADMITYVVITGLIYTLTGTNVGGLLSQRVEQGTIAIDLIRPLRLRRTVMAESFGQNLFGLLVKALPPLITVAAIFGISLPSDPATIPLFAVSLTLGIALSYYLGYLLGLTSFWFKTTFHVDWFNQAFMMLFGGTFVPIWFYPDVLKNISRYLPFRMIAFDPANVFLERLSTNEILQLLGSQAIWLVILIVACELVWIPARRVVTVHGG